MGSSLSFSQKYSGSVRNKSSSSDPQQRTTIRPFIRPTYFLPHITQYTNHVTGHQQSFPPNVIVLTIEQDQFQFYNLQQFFPRLLTRPIICAVRPLLFPQMGLSERPSQQQTSDLVNSISGDTALDAFGFPFFYQRTFAMSLEHWYKPIRHPYTGQQCYQLIPKFLSQDNQNVVDCVHFLKKKQLNNQSNHGLFDLHSQSSLGNNTQITSDTCTYSSNFSDGITHPQQQQFDEPQSPHPSQQTVHLYPCLPPVLHFFVMQTQPYHWTFNNKTQLWSYRPDLYEAGMYRQKKLQKRALK
jgi:hypothetical protein